MWATLSRGPKIQERILIIKHGALGDVILASGAMHAIRHYHPYAALVLLTTPPFVTLAEQMGIFDEILVDPRPKLWRLPALREVLRLLKGEGERPFRRIYDLQNSDRTAWYFHCLGFPKPQWVGKVKGCSHPRNLPDNQYHILDLYERHLTRIGLPALPLPTVDWLLGDSSQFNLPERYVLIVPSCAAHRLKKRWTVSGYAALIRHLANLNLTAVIVGAEHDKPFVDAIIAASLDSDPINLAGKTTLGDVASIARQAVFAVGSDTGPMHIIALTGCRVLVLFSEDSNPALCGPRGQNVVIHRVPDLQSMPFDETLQAKLPLLECRVER